MEHRDRASILASGAPEHARGLAASSTRNVGLDPLARPPGAGSKAVSCPVVRARSRAGALVIEQYRSIAVENRCSVHGPCLPPEAAELVVRTAVERAVGRTVALAVDPGMAHLGLDEKLAAAGSQVLAPRDREWSAQLADAGVGVTSAFMAVAATGSLVLVAGRGSPRAASLVPAAHVCLLRAADIVADVEAAFERLAAMELPSAVIWVGGPSRTADLEMRPTFGIHGPKSVDVVIVDG
jgi:L-lactate dehydrogenase complex protein LldG